MGFLPLVGYLPMVGFLPLVGFLPQVGLVCALYISFLPCVFSSSKTACLFTLKTKSKKKKKKVNSINWNGLSACNHFKDSERFVLSILIQLFSSLIPNR